MPPMQFVFFPIRRCTKIAHSKDVLSLHSQYTSTSSPNTFFSRFTGKRNPLHSIDDIYLSFPAGCYPRQRERGIHQNGSHMQDKALPTSRFVPAFKQVVESEMDTGSTAQAGGASLRGKAPLSGQPLG